MISRNKGILSLEFLVPNLGLIFAIVVTEMFYSAVVRPNAEELLLKSRVLRAQAGANAKADLDQLSLYIIIKDPEQQWEVVLFLWAMIVLSYKLTQIGRERRLFKHDFIHLQTGERIIPEDAFDRYKEMKAVIEKEPKWKECLLPECMLAALHRFHASHSIQDAANAVKERTDLAAEQLESALSLVRYIAWAIPAIGFIGTVRGIGGALAYAQEAIQGDISAVTSWLGLAFNSTLVALLLSLVLMFILHQMQSRQEAFIIETQTYCRDRLIDVMKVPTKDESSPVLA
ncbi:MAG: MotA/TolQ/ExbB proton channel family protein [Opitutaceae bacterium]|nr:MotA/TolQ/ExbB proton channel family protein [Opitutaceae bacterium]